MTIHRTALAALAVAAFAAPALGDSFSGSGYPARDLLLVCQLADNDSRELGRAAEIECEQYLIGFADALKSVGQTGPGSGICPPDVNTPDEIRWAFVKWVHADFSERRDMPAADAVLTMLKDSFACQ
jgi:hypothetical protein